MNFLLFFFLFFLRGCIPADSPRQKRKQFSPAAQCATSRSYVEIDFAQPTSHFEEGKRPVVERAVSPATLLARDLAVEAGERYGEGLHGTHGVLVVQRENVVRYPAKLHHYVVH